MKKYQHLCKQYNTWFAEIKIPKDVRNHFGGKTRFTKSLQTDDKELAEILKLEHVQDWKLQIRAARGQIDPQEDAQKLRQMYLLRGQSEQAAKDVASLIFTSEEQLEEDQRVKLYAAATGLRTSTSAHIEEFMAQKKYSPYVETEARRFLSTVFAPRFPYFEDIQKKDLRLWATDLELGRKGYAANKRATVGKKLSYVRAYWAYCEDRHTDAPNIIDHVKIMGEPNKTKAAIGESSNTSYIAFTPEECFRLYDAAVDDGYPYLADIILLGMHTGCRIGELCHMTLDRVTNEWLQVADAKTESGNREIPIHRDIQQLVERLKQTSTDGYLLSNLSANNAYTDRSRGMSQKFGRLKSKLGFQTKRHAFHSFRSTLSNRFENAGVEENLAARIIGHKIATMTYGRYSGGIDWKLAVQTMARIEYKR